jgi:hypothetical protein
MAKSRLNQVLDLFSKKDSPLSLGYIAHSLEIRPEMAESMLQYWIQKGRIRPGVIDIDCGVCGVNETCPFVNRLPTSYYLVDLKSDQLDG